MSTYPIDKISDEEMGEKIKAFAKKIKDYADGPQLYTMRRKGEDGEWHTLYYAYGLPWVAQALYMDDIKFDTPEEAKAWWEENYGA